MSLSLNIRTRIETPAKKRDYNEQLFTRVATEYDMATRAMSLGQDLAWKRRLVQLLPSVASPNCVDLACGTGDVMLELGSRYATANITGVDLTSGPHQRHGGDRSHSVPTNEREFYRW